MAVAVQYGLYGLADDLGLPRLEKMLQNAGPIRDDGTDKFFGLENV